jgi:regulator of nucleoside diphosphate kinase
MTKPISVTLTDYNRIVGLIEGASIKYKMPNSVSTLYKRLQGAMMYPQDAISRGVITMNSCVQLKELSSGRETEVTVVYPADADATARKISVFSEIGMALFGQKEREIVCWNIPGGTGMFEIVNVTYQPEAAGDFYL